MAKQKIVRIDYRLIHGQVVAKWIKYYPVNRIIVADDELKNDAFMCDIYKMAAPGNEVEIVGLAEWSGSVGIKCWCGSDWKGSSIRDIRCRLIQRGV